MGSFYITVTAFWILCASISSLLESQSIKAPSLSQFTHRLQIWQMVTKRNGIRYTLELLKHLFAVIHAKIILFTFVDDSNAVNGFSALNLLVIVIFLDALPYEI